MQVVEYGLQPVVSPAALQRDAPVELVRAAATVHHPPLDHDTQVAVPFRHLKPAQGMKMLPAARGMCQTHISAT